jgi:hypothetical protein
MRARVAAVLALAVLGCEPSIPQTPPPTSLNFAVFNLTTGQIPQPNDLALQSSAIASLPNGAEKELLTTFAQQGGFPSDQATPVTFQFQRMNVDTKTGKVTFVAPQLDLTSLTPQTLVAFQVSAAGIPLPVALAPVAPADYVISGDVGTLTLHNQNNAPWAAGSHVIVGIRGGPQGVTVNGGQPIQASADFFVILSSIDLNNPNNTTLLPGTRSQQIEEGMQIMAIRMGYEPVFMAIDTLAFPHDQLAALTTFQIATPPSAFVQTSTSSSVFPLPSDYLLDPSGTHVQDIPAFGPLAAGISTLDGFSTTAAITAQTNAPILASTITGSTVLLYNLADPAHPVLVPDASPATGGYVTEPPQVVQNMMGVGVTTVIALQPAVPLNTAQGFTALPPLAENTEYAVVVTNSVQDLNQKGLSSSTLSNIVLFTNPLVNSSGQSTLPGVDNATAASLERMRLLLQPVVAQVKTDRGITRSQISAAWTFRTQTITGKNSIGNPAATPGLLQFAALPYANAQQSTMFVPSTPTVSTPTDAFARFGVDTSIVPDAAIAEVLDTTYPTINLLSDTTGAFDPNHASIETLKLLLAVPNPTAVPACPSGGAFPAGAHCAPLVIFQHGLGGARGDMLTVANELAAKGFIVASIDAPKFGDRSWCSSDSQCAPGGTCVPIPGAAAQGDMVPPGTCSAGLEKVPMLCATAECLTAWMAAPDRDGLAVASSNYLVSGNLFRTRDSLRQDVIDESALILSLSRPPSLPATAQANPVVTHLAMSGIVIDPTAIYSEGQSFGAILGTLNAAANSRLSRAALNAGGGTIVDVLTNAPALTPRLDPLLAGLGLQPGTMQYFQFLLLAKWVLDPAEPVNFANNLLGDASHPTLPNLLTMSGSQTGKPVLAQLAACDDTVPNAFNLELYGLIGVGPQGGGKSTQTLFVNTADAGGTCPFGVATTSPGTVPHTFLTNWGVTVNATTGVATVDPNITHLTLIAQDQNAAFLADPTQLPPPTQTQP